MPKKKKVSKRKRKRAISLDSLNTCQAHGEKDYDPINQDENEIETAEEEKEFFTPLGIEKTPMAGSENSIWDVILKTQDNGVPASGVDVGGEGNILRNGCAPSGNKSSSDSSRKHKSSSSSSSSSSSDEDSKSNKNRPDKEDVGKLVKKISVPKPTVVPVERVESESLPEITEVEAAHVLQATPVDSNKNESDGFSSAETKDKITPSPETASEGCRESVDPLNQHNKETQIDSAHPPGRPASWKCCCGFFELFTGSDR